MIADRRSRFKMLTNPGSGGLGGFFETTKGQKKDNQKRPKAHWTLDKTECRMPNADDAAKCSREKRSSKEKGNSGNCL